jgi:uncharacterized protein
MSASHGTTMAMWPIAVIYENGMGVSRDYRQALSWYQKAAEGGDAHGYYGIGMMYRMGLGVPRDPSQARIWLGKAAALGFDGPHE